MEQWNRTNANRTRTLLPLQPHSGCFPRFAVRVNSCLINSHIAHVVLLLVYIDYPQSSSSGLCSDQ
jgi:hypothetical protein